MIKFYFLPFLPFMALLCAWACGKLPTKLVERFPALTNLAGHISALFAIIFLVAALGIRRIKNSLTLDLFELPNNFNIAFSFDSRQMFFLLVLGGFWLFTVLHSNRYFSIVKDKKKGQFNILFLAIIGFISCIILSKNLLTAALFYQFLAVIIYYTANFFTTKQTQKSVKYFGFFTVFTSSLLFLAAALTFKISGQIDFMLGGVFDETTINLWEFCLLLFFYILAIASMAFVPFHLLFGNLYYLSPPAIIATVLSFSMAILILFYKVVFYIFGIKLFINFMEQINSFNLVTIILAMNLLALPIFALLSKNLKQILTLLLFNQVIAVIMAFMIFGLSAKKMQVVIASFVFGQLLIFIAVGNINLYLKESKDKAMNGVFYKLRLTVLALIFALLNLTGIIPSAGMSEKYWLFRDIMHNNSWINGSVVVTNIILCLICSVKILYPMLEIRKEVAQSSEEQNQVEHDLSLISPILILPAGLFALLLPFFTSYLIR